MARQYEGIREDKARGTWTARYRVAPGPKGTRTKRGFATQAAAKQWRDEQAGKVARGNFVDPRDASQTVGSVYLAWIALYQLSPDIERATVDAKSSHWRSSLAPTFEEMPLSRINKAVIRTWQGQRLAAGRVATTINNEHATLAQILDFAMDMGALDRNYAREVKRLGKFALKPKADPNAETIARLMAEIAPRYLIVLNLALYAGLRSGEARGLRLEDVRRLDDGTCALEIVEQINSRGGKRKSKPKGRKTRTVYESGFVADLIDAHVSFYGTGPGGEVVTNAQGGTLSYSGWWHIWQAAIKASGVSIPKGQGAHLLRHAYASYAVANGASPAEVAANLGHAQISTTFAYYVHATDRRPVGGAAARSAIDEAAARIEADAAITRTPRARVGDTEA